MVASKDVPIENGIQIGINNMAPDCNITFNTHVKNNIRYTSWDDGYDNQCMELFKFLSNLQTSVITLNEKEVVVINVHNRYFAREEILDILSFLENF